MWHNSESRHIKDLRSGNNLLFKDIKAILERLITARKNHAEFGVKRSPPLHSTHLSGVVSGLSTELSTERYIPQWPYP